MNFARIDAISGAVINVELWDEIPEDTAEHLFREVQSGAGIGWTWDGGGFVPPTDPVLSLEEAKAAKAQAVRDLRWQKETGGILVGDTPIRTDEKSQAKLNGAVSLFQLDPAKTQIDSWEAVPGVFVTLSKAEIEAIGLAVGAHIQACFDRSKVLCGEITAAGDQAALDAIDITTGWPETMA